MWQVAPCLYVGAAMHSARSHSRFLFSLFLFKHPGLTVHCPSRSSPPGWEWRGLSGEEGWDGSCSRTGRSEGRALTSLFSPF